MTNTIPVKIRPHLIPFFYKEFEGTDGSYMGEKVKACKICLSSTLGMMLKSALQESPEAIKPQKFYVYISLTNSDGSLYWVENNRNNFLSVPEALSETINNIFEDHFRLALVYFVRGMLRNRKHNEILVRDAISEFMLEYELDEYNFELESLRRILDRGTQNKMKRLQNKVSHRFLK